MVFRTPRASVGGPIIHPPNTNSPVPTFQKAVSRFWKWNCKIPGYGGNQVTRTDSTEHILGSNEKNDSKVDQDIQRGKNERFPGTKLPTVAACSALLVNIILAASAFGIAYSRPGPHSFLMVPLNEGSCSQTKKWSIGLHLVINILGTVILSSSNYCAQFLGAPRRCDVDRAHCRGSWMDIGIPSLRNIWALSLKNKLLWGVLFITTIPIHALYNSVLVMSKSSNEFNIFIAPADYNGTAPLHLTEDSNSCFQSEMDQSLSTFNSALADSSFELLTKEQCANEFSVSYLSGHGQLVILSSNITWNDDNILLSAGTGNAVKNYGPLSSAAPYGWMCVGDYYTCTKSRLQDQLGDWEVLGTEWSRTTWQLTMPYFNGTTATFDTNNLPSCLSRDVSDPLCVDISSLLRFVWSPTPVSRDEIQSHLRDSDNWANSTWAKEITFDADASVCDKVDERAMMFDRYAKHYTVDGCLSVQVDEHCQLLFSPLFSIVVLGCNLVKVACIIWIAYYERKPRLLTVGDAIASFLSEPDPVTKGRCLASKADWKKNLEHWNGRGRQVLPRRLNQRRKHWWEAASILQWALALFLSIGVIVGAGTLLNQGLSDFKLVAYTGTSLSALWQLGFGNMNASTIIFRVDTSILGNVLVANMPQIAISISYYFYNTVLTSMLMAAEYDGYAVPGISSTTTAEKPQVAPKKALRVSGTLAGCQRSTYWLSLPYRYSVPLLSSYAMLHWLVSESIFFVRVNMYDSTQTRVPNADVNACGWSPMALILSIAMGSLMVLALLGISMRRFRSCIPLAGSCSAAISAACHRPRDDSNAALEAVIWGEFISSGTPLTVGNNKKGGVVVEVHSVDSDVANMGYPHCGFTSYNVVQPSEGQVFI